LKRFIDQIAFLFYFPETMQAPRLLLRILTTVCLLQVGSLHAQNTNPYHMNGSAFQENCNCYTLTGDEFNQSGSVWNINKINLNQSFDYKFNVNLGCRDGDGADGLVFVLQPISTSIGTTGGGLGYQGVSPSIGIAIDTWQNLNDNDPPFDHLSIHKNGDLNHQSSNNLAGPSTASNINIEDCQWHVLRIVWNANSRLLYTTIDGKDSTGAVVDMVNTVFGGDPQVFWGFTGSTGGSRNRQRFCTSLNPAIASLSGGTVTCYPTPIQFADSSVSFGEIVKWYWDFGDGTKDTVKTPAPHVFPAPGVYEIKLNILGNNGCVSDTVRKQIIVGSQPVVKFGYDPPLLCDNTEISFLDSSTVQFGSIANWEWNLVGISSETVTRPEYTYQPAAPGAGEMQLTVATKEGCVSAPVSKFFEVFPMPEVAFTVEDVCAGDPVLLSATLSDPGQTIRRWYWSLGDGTNANAQALQHMYKSGGRYDIKLVAESTNGCITDTVRDVVNIYATNAFAGADTIVAAGQPIQLHGSGGIRYRWSPATGLSDPNIANPVAIIEKDARYTLTAYTDMGCETSDEIFLKVLKGPAIYVPNAFTPNGDGRNDVFRFIPVGMKELYYFRVFNRYGQLVHSGSNPALGWDGTANGKKQNSGTYVWMVSGKDYNDQPHVLRGTVTLIR
jgi:gliding motility-associated-like protein